MPAALPARAPAYQTSLLKDGGRRSPGVLSMPGTDEDVIGGHAVLAVGYDDSSQTFLVRNSWGTTWGQAGYFTMPYAYLTTRGLSSDFWTIRIVT